MIDTTRNLPSTTRVWLARGIAMAADAVQLGLAPLFSVPQPLEPVLDVIVCVLMVALVGWHIAFLPSVVIETLPIADLAPTWTIAVLIATRKGGRKSEVEPAVERSTVPR
jgi:hypothetical protein